MELFMRKVTTYSKAIKASVLAKLMSPSSRTIVELTKEFNIPYGTIVTWKKELLKKQNMKHIHASQSPNDKSPEAKLQAVIDTMGRTEEEQGAYCRKQGIYPSHLDVWKKQMLDGLGAVVNTKERKAENQQVKNELKQLKSDLHRKDKALAEVSALLILKKKADLLWGADEDA